MSLQSDVSFHFPPNWLELIRHYIWSSIFPSRDQFFHIWHLDLLQLFIKAWQNKKVVHCNIFYQWIWEYSISGLRIYLLICFLRILDISIKFRLIPGNNFVSAEVRCEIQTKLLINKHVECPQVKCSYIMIKHSPLTITVVQ